MAHRSVSFGIFDHVDRSNLPPREYFEARLRLIETYDRGGFSTYHCAEHHLAPLGMVPSPNVFLAAVAQRTHRLRFGPLVYVLPLYHPVRLLEEIALLDQLSGGRLELGFGRGSSKAENRYFGENHDDAERLYVERLDLILSVLTRGTIDIAGAPASYQGIPITYTSLQRPHPPIWYGIHSVDSADRAARRAFNVLSLDPVPETRACTDRYHAVWHELHGDAPTPKIGIGRFVVVARDDATARTLARRAYRRWFANFTYTGRTHDVPLTHSRAPEFDEMCARGQAVAGTPETVAAFVAAQLDAAGANYFVGQFAFGDLAPDDTQTSVELFIREVMPAFSGALSSRT
jgi:alkanesulfonate monooxygenase SsuD/methylene tetrahydromethanopterin reductase-like flavin-dependent oxidoreductase (luciferase family)